MNADQVAKNKKKNGKKKGIEEVDAYALVLLPFY
jgi:hypothetical protein